MRKKAAIIVVHCKFGNGICQSYWIASVDDAMTKKSMILVSNILKIKILDCVVDDAMTKKSMILVSNILKIKILDCVG